jgi:hypothetical protein
METSTLTSRHLVALLLVVPALVLAGCGAADETAPSDSPTALDDAGVAGADAAFVELQERGGSGLAGAGTLTPEEGGVQVDLDVWRDDFDDDFYGGDEALPGDDDEPFGDGTEDEPLEGDLGFEDELLGLAVEIRRGSCEAPGETVHELGTLEYGRVTASVDTSMDVLMGGDHVLVVVRGDDADDDGRLPEGDDQGLVACGVLDESAFDDDFDDDFGADEFDDDEFDDDPDDG